MKYDKLRLENQEKTATMSKFLIAINRLKSDLHFLYISKNLRILGLVENNNDSPVKKSINEAENNKHEELNKEDQISKICFIEKRINTNS